MKTKAIALFLLLNLFSATSVFASSASANTTSNNLFSSNYGGRVWVEVHNHSDWTVSVFIDDEFVDYLSPHSHMTVPTGSGFTRLFARADCSCGRSLTWSSTNFYYAGNTYPWILKG